MREKKKNENKYYGKLAFIGLLRIFVQVYTVCIYIYSYDFYSPLSTNSTCLSKDPFLPGSEFNIQTSQSAFSTKCTPQRRYDDKKKKKEETEIERKKRVLEFFISFYFYAMYIYIHTDIYI